jgi:serine/threonine protein kinase
MDFPLVKLAHQTPLARQLVRNEFSVLSELSSQCLPVVKFHHSSLEDRSGIFGFSMQKLFRIDPSDLPSYGDALKDAIIRLHSKGFVHGDVHPSNIMRTENHEIRLIDLGHAGKVGEPIPEYHPARTLKHWHTFEAKMDLLELEKIMKL